MSISPMNFNGMIQNTNEVSHAKANEDQKPMLQQENLTHTVAKQQEQQSKQVNDTYKADREDERYDREGNGKGYEGNKKRKLLNKKKDDEKRPDGSVTEKHTTSFDMRI
ncbi:hypothetical protein SAMN02910384_00328 [Pseudobutyrivibrio sp. ACV-2]|uniref:hypothetical protein n=1 Tax=Pseudobutyrivibrio sp. ACV-2 TaxID=1520801 RepID=UPI000897F9C2|nr:hypothetical protein [Pseudobutyrivibrio sp. ACV-2]SDZ85154.1 hypothetical protein SAMN02910384_00328 [Pseudobutyrivibrio sp. ACV-2]